MDPQTYNLFSAVFVVLNFITTIAGVVLVVLSLRETGRSIRKSIDHYSYDIWKTVYLQMANYPKTADLFSLEKDKSLDFKVLSVFLMILDMYANKFSDDYSKLTSEASLLKFVMKSEASRKYWALCKDHFFSDRGFVEAIDQIVASSE